MTRPGARRRRAWKKLHIGMDAESWRFIAAMLTDRAVDDAAQVAPLLDQTGEPPVALTGDGAYDRTKVYVVVSARHPEAAMIVPPRIDAALSDAVRPHPRSAGRHIQTMIPDDRRDGADGVAAGTM